MAEQQTKKKVSKLANAAVGSVVAGLMAFVFLVFIFPGYTMRELSYCVIHLSLVLGFPLAIAALMHIMRSKKELTGIGRSIVALALWVILAFLLLLPIISTHKKPAGRLVCGSNIKGLGTALNVYVYDYKDMLPVEGWNDLLMAEADVYAKSYICPESDCVEGEECCYAMNVAAAGKKVSELPADMVLLFESKPGWNQVGGRELLNLENHNGEGCNILFADGSTQFVRADRIGQLRWTVDEEVEGVFGDDRPVGWAVSVDKAGCGNLHKVSDGLYRGEQPTAEGFKELEKMGVKTIVNLRSLHSDKDKLKGTSLEYAHVRMEAWEPELDEVVEALKVMTDKTKQPVFVHCMHGADRTGTVVAIYRIVEQGWEKEDAIKEMREGGFGYHEMWKGMPKFIRGLDVEAVKKELGK